MSGVFVAGGTLRPGVASYITRAADDELYAAVQACEYCSVLTTRQMGKSSLMARTADRLRTDGVVCATVDLQGKGGESPPVEQWYYGVAKQIADGLRLPAEWSAWWKGQTLLLPSQRLTDFFGDVVLAQMLGRVVVFVDEVDWTIKLPFSDEFFAAIRSCFNRRATDAAFGRLTFVLLGSASPAQLIKDVTRTPFNVGRNIELADFSAAEAAPLARWLGKDGSARLGRILYWTGGHPYLTQMLCERVERQPPDLSAEQAVDPVVQETLLSSSARKAENNLKFVADRLTQQTSDRPRVLRLYGKVLREHTVVNIATSPVHLQLRLSGVVKADGDGRLHVRNRVYRQVFDEAWVRQVMPSTVRPIAAAAAAFTVLTSALWYFVLGPRVFVDGRVIDEALQASRSASDFVPADEDYFREMDAGSYAPPEVVGRNMWMLWTGGNDRFWDQLASLAPIDLLKTISSSPAAPYGRHNRFRFFGVTNEPCFTEATAPDASRFGLWLDTRDPSCAPDPFANVKKYPGVRVGARGKNVPVSSYYGEPTGIVGLRLFPNPAFTAEAQSRWDADRYYKDPSYYSSSTLVRPYRVGVACVFCHVGLDAVRPPVDPENPKWTNLSPVAGGQYLWLDRVFNASGATDSSAFLFQLMHTARPGTFDTSLLFSDGINNPRAINGIYHLGPRLNLAQQLRLEEAPTSAPTSQPRTVAGVPVFQADAADSIGLLPFLNRFYLSLGTFSEELLLHAQPFRTGLPPSPVDVERIAKSSVYFQATQAMTGNLVAFLVRASRSSPQLQFAPGGPAFLMASPSTMERGRDVFADRCASCHSSKLPTRLIGIDRAGCGGAGYLSCWNDYWQWTMTNEFKQAMRGIVSSPDFAQDNYLSNDARVPITLLQTNACSALASNATAGGIWDRFSSASYKALPSVGTIQVYQPISGRAVVYAVPAGGRGYTRTPSLVGLWATAPFLLNNTVGRFTADPSVAGRMEGFQDAIEQLLWPEKRPRDELVAGLPGAIDRVTQETTQVPVFEVILPRGTPIGLFANLSAPSDDVSPVDRTRRNATLLRLTKNMTVDQVVRQRDRDDLPSPSDFAPYADELLSVSACPDFVVNRGHEFGRDLSDDDKRALIELLKTF